MRPARTLRTRKALDRLFGWLGCWALLLSVGVLLGLFAPLAFKGASRLTPEFFTNFPSRFASRAGILSAWVGSMCVMAIAALFTIPLGVAAGVHLEEYAPRNRWTSMIEINISNLAGVPSILYGLLALGVFVYGLGLGHSLLTAGCTLGLLVLPLVIVATREALRTVPREMREAAAALGATKWQVTWQHTLPYSLGGILTGIIIALSRAIGETAPLVTLGALTYIAFLPESPLDPFTVLPIQMFNWVSRPQTEFQANAAAAGVVLLVLTLCLNAVAIVIRWRFRRRIKW